ncbi:MAG: HD domain-containing protein [Acidimicrobiia bacterium]|nr:HD domain-containing protein [Acidimicrobiia bacterium]
MSDQRESRTTVYCVGLALAAAALGAVLGVRGPLPALTPLIALSLLHVFAENQITDLTPELGSSAGVMLCTAAIVVFRTDQSALGVLLVGAAGGLYLPHLIHRDWRKLLFNCAQFALVAVASAGVFWTIVGSGKTSPGLLLLAAIPTALTYSIGNVVLVSMAVVLSTGQRFRDVLLVGSREYFVFYPFALLGVFLGLLYLDYELALVPLFLVPLIVARQAYSSYLALKRSHEATVRILVGALEAKDPYTAGHAERVAEYAQYIGLELGIPPNRLERLRLAALMHDVGKLVVPNHLLNKPGKLTAEEFDIVRKHEDVSVEILTRIDFLAPVAPSATSEAAQFSPIADDRGQPVEPHIVAVADAYDAMTSTRSYRRALSQEIAFAELRKNSGRQFHPRVVDALIAALRRRGEVHGAGHEMYVHHVSAPSGHLGSAGLGDLLPDGEVEDDADSTVRS